MNILIFIGVLALLIFIHELGHFLAAKFTGMKVEEFSVGFKPAIFQKKIGETNYVLGAIPIGGYVKILGENPNEEEEEELSEEDKKRTFSARPKWAQILVLSMGVIFNILLAWILISFSLFSGITTEAGKFPAEYIQKKEVKILGVKNDFPAEKVGLKVGDEIVKISSGEKEIKKTNAESFKKFLNKNKSNLKVFYHRKNLDGIFETEKFDLKNFQGNFIAGFYITDIEKVQLPIHKAFYYGISATWEKLKEITIGLLDFFGQVFTAKADLDEVSGPVGIVKYIGQAAQAGFVSLLLFTALLSLNLAVINFLPFPALDGGRVVFVLIEAITRKKIPNSIFNWVNGLGFLFLIILMIVITFNDIWKIFH